MRQACFLSLVLLTLSCSGAPAPEQTRVLPDGRTARRMEIERLPDLNVPRSGHSLFWLDGELVAVGGHSIGFVPTATAEICRDGRWTLVETLFPHDFGFGTLLPSGEIFIAGGCSEPFGVGRSFGAELYSPETGSFSPLPILDIRRALATVAPLTDGTLVVAGNWYADDAVCSYSFRQGGKPLLRPAQHRSAPYILQTGPSDAFIFAPTDNRGNVQPVVVDRLQGAPFEPALLQEWRPLGHDTNFRPEQLFVGDATVGGYAWLIPAARGGQYGILTLVGETFSLLETDAPLPMLGVDGEEIRWGALFADKETETAYYWSLPTPAGRSYVCTVAYGDALRGGKAGTELLYAETGPASQLFGTLLPGGRLAVAGGILEDNYHPYGGSFILHTRPTVRKTAFAWPWLTAGTLLPLALLVFWLLTRRKRAPAAPQGRGDVEQGAALFMDMMSRIRALMEERELFKRSDLKVEDVANELGTNAAYVRGCISGAYGGPFKDFVNEYRIRYVQKQLLAHPDEKISALAEEAGFSSSATFYRQFSALTGLAPAAWLKQARRKENLR